MPFADCRLPKPEGSSRGSTTPPLVWEIGNRVSAIDSDHAPSAPLRFLSPMRTILLLVLLAGTSPLVAQQVENYRKLEFMAGCWQAQPAKDQTVEEHWSMPTETIMLGFTRYFTKEKPTNWDFNYIIKVDTAVYLILGPHGQVPDTFRAKTLTDEVAAWQREGTRFPGTVMYRK